MLRQRNFDLRARQRQCAHGFHFLWIEDHQLVANGRKHFSLRGNTSWITHRSGDESGFEYLLFLFRIECKESGFLLTGPCSAAAVNRAAAKDQAGPWFKRQRDDALVGNKVAVIFNRSISARVPNPKSASQFAIRRFAA